jgi:hypothetical protein
MATSQYDLFNCQSGLKPKLNLTGWPATDYLKIRHEINFIAHVDIVPGVLWAGANLSEHF